MVSSTHSSLQNSQDNRITQAQRTALSDARMLEVAIKLIVERGTEKTTLKDVGEMAGYSRGLAGYRFGSKQGLFSFVIRAIGEEWLQELKRVAEGKVGLDAIRVATDAHYRFCQDAPDHVRAFYILWFESISPGAETKDVIAGVHRRRQKDVMEWINEAIEQGVVDKKVDADVVAAQFCSALVGIVYEWLVNPKAMDEIKQLHEGLKDTMQILLGPAHDKVN